MLEITQNNTKLSQEITKLTRLRMFWMALLMVMSLGTVAWAESPYFKLLGVPWISTTTRLYWSILCYALYVVEPGSYGYCLVMCLCVYVYIFTYIICTRMFILISIYICTYIYIYQCVCTYFILANSDFWLGVVSFNGRLPPSKKKHCLTCIEASNTSVNAHHLLCYFCCATVDGSEIPISTTWKCIIKPCKLME